MWSPDGRRVAFSRGIGDTEEIYWQAVDGSGEPEQLTESSVAGGVFPMDFSPDGTTLVYQTLNTPRDIWIAPVDSAPSSGTPLIATSAGEENATVSPDGRWVAYQSNASERFEIYVRPFPDVDSGGLRQISTDGGTRPRWSRDGTELFYFVEGSGNENSLMTVPVEMDESGSTFELGVPEILLQGDFQATNSGRYIYDVSLDDQRFLMIKRAATPSDAPEPRIVVVQNWFEELERLVPTE